MARLCLMVICALGLVACDEGGDAVVRCEPEACGADERCAVVAGALECRAVCMPPRAPRFSRVPLGTRLSFPAGALVKVADEEWREATSVALTSLGLATVSARWGMRPAACDSDPLFEASYEVVEHLPGAQNAADAADDAVAKDDARFVAWASGVSERAFGADLDAAWKDVSRALGPATGAWDDALSLGNGGAVTFTFDAPFGDHASLDLVVFENGFSSAFLELAFVEVSSDGLAFARFPTLSIQEAPVEAYGTLDASQVLGLAGRHADGFGTGFDLAHLADDPVVLTGRVDLGAIRFVRIVDLVGDGQTRDSFGAPIYDPTPTIGPAGFDVEAIGVLR